MDPTDACLAGSPVLSVIIVNYNAGDLLMDCVQAVLASPIELEVVISDNGSTDGSLTRVRRHQGEDPRLTILEHGSNLGFARGKNLALARTRAPYVFVLNPDCIVWPDSLGHLLDFMDATPDAGMAGCMIRNPDGSEQRADRRRIPNPRIGLTRFLHLARFFLRLTRNGRLDLIDDPVPEGPVSVEAISGAFIAGPQIGARSGRPARRRLFPALRRPGLARAFPARGLAALSGAGRGSGSPSGELQHRSAGDGGMAQA